LKNDIQQILMNLRKAVPFFSEKVGNYEQVEANAKENIEVIKGDISTIVSKLIEELRNREKFLHAEAEKLMNSQMRTQSYDKDNASLDMNNFLNFCDSTDALFKRGEVLADSQLIAIKNQCCESLERFKEMTYVANSANSKLKFITPNFNDMVKNIQNFGEFASPNESSVNSSISGLNFTQNSTENQFEPKKKRQTWTKPNSELEISPMKSIIITPQGATNRSTTTPRSIFGPSPFTSQPSTSEPIIKKDSLTVQNRPRSRQIFGTAQSASTETLPQNRPRSRQIFGNNTISYTRNDPIESQRPRMIRSTTFDLDGPSTNRSVPNIAAPKSTSQSVDVNELYNVRRRARAPPPLSFDVMLTEPETSIRFDMPVQSELVHMGYNEPKINYSAKTKAKLIIGRQGREPGEFVWPIGVNITPSAPHIMVADSNNHRIQIFEADGRFLRAIGSHGKRDGQFDVVSDIAVDAMANMYVSDRHNHRLQVFDRYGRFVRMLGSGPGSAPGQLNFPWGISINRFSEVFVCDKENDRVCVFHLTGRFIRSFGVHGSKPGQFDKPYYVHVTNENLVIVSDCSNHRVQIFDPYGNLLHYFGSEGKEQGQFKHPRGVVTDVEGFILVADSGNSRVQVFRPDGTFVTHFGAPGTDSGKFRGLEGIAVTQSGDVVVCDKENHRIQIL